MVSLEFTEEKSEASLAHSEWLLRCTAYDGWSWQWWYGAVFVEENTFRRIVL